jgi:hypothetical protein
VTIPEVRELQQHLVRAREQKSGNNELTLPTNVVSVNFILIYFGNLDAKDLLHTCVQKRSFQTDELRHTLCRRP